MKLLSIGKYGLHTIQYPSKRWGYVGTIPEVLCIDKKDHWGMLRKDSPVFETEAEAIQYFEERKHLIN
jgi:hypothetical protein